jgi:hypothetical protein
MSALDHPTAPLALTFFKRRWLDDVVDLLVETLETDVFAFDDIDLDNDLLELLRVTGRVRLCEMAREVLDAREPLPESAGLAALAPDMEGDAAQVFLRLLGVNLAFRFRSDELIASLIAFAAEGPQPRLLPADLGQLLARARSVREARVLIEASPLSAEERESALAATEIKALDLAGARLHVQADAEALERALDRAMRPRTRHGWTQGLGSAERRRFLAHKRRGEWFTLMEEGDAPSPELAKALAKESGIQRVAWVRFAEGEEPDILLIEGTRVVVDAQGLAAQVGAQPSADDVSGLLRGLGVLDLDPGHARGVPALRWAASAGLDFKKKSMRSFCFA